nr:M24 family metallopeptidase [Natrinema salifodinae]
MADDAADFASERRHHATETVRSTLAERDAAAFVHVGTERDPGLRYVTRRSPQPSSGVTAVAYDGVAEEWLVRATERDETGDHPAARLASELADRGLEGPVLSPARIPHDAALYLERAGFDLASTAVLERARARKTPGERDQIATAQRAASAGIRRAASLLANAAVVDGRLAVADDEAAADGGETGLGSGPESEFLTPARLRTAIDQAIVGAGAFPDGNTAVNPGLPSAGEVDDPLRPGDPIVVETAPRGLAGYYGGLVRTLVVDSDGGRERRVHVAVTQSFRSARSMLTAGPESVAAVEADLEAEVRSFGLDDRDEIEASVSGVGLEPRERPVDGGESVGPGTVVRLDVSARVDDDHRLRIADIVAVNEEGERPARFAAPSHSLSPAALLEDSRKR